MTQLFANVTYPTLKTTYKKYTWDISIGNVGGFRYEDYDGNFTDKPIELVNISDIKICNDDITYSTKNNILGVSKTTIDLPNVPIGSEFGWDDTANCWVYFTDDSKCHPTHYASYVI